nr:MAG TPA: hypothetical protein [Caudoviricetes sp.]
MNDLTFQFLPAQFLPALEVRSFFMSYFLSSPLFFTLLLYHDIRIKSTLFFNFCSRIVNIIAEIFIPHRVFVYKS